MKKIIKSSTPTQFFTTKDPEMDFTNADDIEVQYEQDDEVIFTKTLGDISIVSPKQFSVVLSEEETEMLKIDSICYIRILVVFGNTRIPSVNKIKCVVEGL